MVQVRSKLWQFFQKDRLERTDGCLGTLTFFQTEKKRTLPASKVRVFINREFANRSGLVLAAPKYDSFWKRVCFRKSRDGPTADSDGALSK